MHQAPELIRLATGGMWWDEFREKSGTLVIVDLDETRNAESEKSVIQKNKVRSLPRERSKKS